MLNSLTRSQCLRSLQSGETENAIGHSRSNYGGRRALKSMSSWLTPKDLLRKSRSLNEADIVTNRRSDEEETIQTEDMSSSIRLNEKFEKNWWEDLAQPQGNLLTKLAKVFTVTTLSRIRSTTTSSRIWILWFNQPTKNLTNRPDISVF